MDASWSTGLLWALAVLLVAVGLVGTVLPALPGPVLVLGGLVLAAGIDGFAQVGGGTIAALCALAVIAYGIDFLATTLGVKRAGASRSAVVGAAIGALVGLFFGLPGLLLGPFLGAVVGELLARRSLAGAGRAGLATWVGLVVGGALKLALVVGMVGLFAFQRFF